MHNVNIDHSLKLNQHLKDKWIKDHLEIAVQNEYRDEFVQKIIKKSILVETINRNEQLGAQAK